MSRVFAGVLCLSILPTLVFPNGRAARGAHFGPYERWIRAQLRVPVDGAVEQAIAEAMETGAGSFEEFIAAFLQAYEAAAPDQSISQVFTDRDLTDDALISYLQRRYSQVADEGILPRVYFVTATLVAAAGEKSSAAHALATGSAAGQQVFGSILGPVVERSIVIAFRTLSSARSLGP